VAAAALANAMLEPVKATATPVAEDEHHISHVLAHILQISAIVELELNSLSTLLQLCRIPSKSTTALMVSLSDLERKLRVDLVLCSGAI